MLKGTSFIEQNNHSNDPNIPRGHFAIFILFVFKRPTPESVCLSSLKRLYENKGHVLFECVTSQCLECSCLCNVDSANNSYSKEIQASCTQVHNKGIDMQSFPYKVILKTRAKMRIYMRIYQKH